MPRIQSARKRMRQNEKRRMRNRRLRSRMRTEIKKFRELLNSQQLDGAREMLGRVYAVIDRTAQKGIIHANTAARYKSRLTRHLNQAGSRAADLSAP